MTHPMAMANPKQVTIAVTGRCNLRCRYCFYADEMASLRDLSTAQWLACFDQLAAMNVMETGLTGGEVFTRPDLFELIDGLIARRMRYSLCSNGTLLDETMLTRFETGKRRLRLNDIQLSVDGSCAEIHNRSRPDSFDATLRALRLLKSAGFPVSVRVTINRHNLNDLDGIARLLLEDIGLQSFSTNDAFPMGQGCRQSDEIALRPREQLTAMQSLDTLLRRYPGRITAQAGPLAKRRGYAEMEEARRTGVKTTRWRMGTLTGCGCVFSKFDILHNGDIVPCHILHRLIMGNVTRDSMLDIWRRHPTLRALRERRAIPMTEVPGCQDCEWTPYCNGSCPGLAHELTGDFNRANPADCYRQFLEESHEDAGWLRTSSTSGRQGSKAGSRHAAPIGSRKT